MSAGATRLEELPLDMTGSMQSVSALAERYATVAASMRAAVSKAEEADDQGTMDFVTEISRDIDSSYGSSTRTCKRVADRHSPDHRPDSARGRLSWRRPTSVGGGICSTWLQSVLEDEAWPRPHDRG